MPNPVTSVVVRTPRWSVEQDLTEQQASELVGVIYAYMDDPDMRKQISRIADEWEARQLEDSE